jgi:NADPH2:quinone reductase
MMKNIPEKMKAINLKKPGAAENMVLQETAIPKTGRADVLIKVHAAGINMPDILQRRGNYPPPPGASSILGLEVAGKIVKIGKNVRGWRIGDKVCALVSGGGYAEYCSAPSGQCLPIPKGFSYAEAAGIPETFFTVWSNIVDRGKIKRGQSILVHGGSGGIGTCAIQVAKILGCIVYVTAGNEKKCKFCKKIGADEAINYKKTDFEKVIRSITKKNGVNMILDSIGGNYVEKNIKVLSKNGHLVNIGWQRGSHVSVNMMPIMLKRLTITGSTLRVRSVAFKKRIAKALLKNIWPYFEKKTIRPIIFKTFSIKNAKNAHKLMESSKHIGKIVLKL